MNKFYINSTKWAEILQSGTEEYIDSLNSWHVFGEDKDEDGQDILEPSTLSGIPYCGCDTCYIREVLSYATCKLLEGIRDGKIEMA